MTTPYLGEIKMFGGNFAPRSYAMCNGQLMAIAQNTALFSLLGTTYGGNGVQTFALPNLQGRLPMNQGSGPGLTPRVIGEASGTESVTLLSTEMPTHNHVFNATSDTGNQPGPTIKSLPATPVNPSPPPPATFYVVPGTSTMNVLPMAATSVGPDGGNLPHENRMPFLCVTFIIALEGIFPSRN